MLCSENTSVRFLSDRICGKFLFGGKILENGPEWEMSLLSAGNMRFEWGMHNPAREKFLSENAGSSHKIAAVELIHSKTVYSVNSAQELNGLKGDGILTQNKALIPVVTVADCMPLFLCDPVRGVFGTLHSGWKGTGIVLEAVHIAVNVYGSCVKDICVVMGPHIHSCCYKVDDSRAALFSSEFGPESVATFSDGTKSLSLAAANLFLLRKAGVPDENICIRNECTCCDKRFGSFRRQTAGLPSDMPFCERKNYFTVQAAWTKWSD